MLRTQSLTRFAPLLTSTGTPITGSGEVKNELAVRTYYALEFVRLLLPATAQPVRMLHP